MPFEKIFPRSFTAQSIRQHAPALSGVYGLTDALGWLFIGETDNIQNSLMLHLEDSVPTHARPRGFVYEVCEHAHRGQRLDRLVREYSPSRSPR